MAMTQLDSGHVIKSVFDESTESLKVKSFSGALVTEKYDFIGITYVPSGNGAGQIQTVTFKLGGSSGTTAATLTLAYDTSNNLVSVTKS